MSNGKRPDQLDEQTIREMAKLALMSNRINEVQEKNLKMWPFVFYDGLQTARIEYDFSNMQTVDTEENSKTMEISYKFNKLETGHFRVTYYLTTSPHRVTDHLTKRHQALEQSVRNMFWKETKVQIYMNDELQYESKDV